MTDPQTSFLTPWGSADPTLTIYALDTDSHYSLVSNKNLYNKLALGTGAQCYGPETTNILINTIIKSSIF